MKIEVKRMPLLTAYKPHHNNFDNFIYTNASIKVLGVNQILLR